MQIYGLKNFQISECENCGALFIYRGAPFDGLAYLERQFEEHLNEVPECKKWHDELPTLMDLRGILSGP
jgi:hypothetical protein